MVFSAVTQGVSLALPSQATRDLRNKTEDILVCDFVAFPIGRKKETLANMEPLGGFACLVTRAFFYPHLLNRAGSAVAA